MTDPRDRQSDLQLIAKTYHFHGGLGGMLVCVLAAIDAGGAPSMIVPGLVVLLGMWHVVAMASVTDAVMSELGHEPPMTESSFDKVLKWMRTHQRAAMLPGMLLELAALPAMLYLYAG